MAAVDRVLLGAVCCGVPAAPESFRVAERILAEMGVND
jgi:hypothetical protein